MLHHPDLCIRYKRHSRTTQDVYCFSHILACLCVGVYSKPKMLQLNYNEPAENKKYNKVIINFPVKFKQALH